MDIFLKKVNQSLVPEDQEAAEFILHLNKALK